MLLLHAAVARNDLAAVTRVVEANPALIYAADDALRTPLLLAVELNLFEIVVYLVRKVSHPSL